MGDGQRPTEGDSRLRGTREPVRQATDARAPRVIAKRLNRSSCILVPVLDFSGGHGVLTPPGDS